MIARKLVLLRSGVNSWKKRQPRFWRSITRPVWRFCWFRQGNLIGFEKCWGLAKINPAVQLELDTPIRAGSISKVITAIAVQQLVESGDLTLETKIGDLLDWPLPYNYGQATLGDLLTHRAGIGERFARQSTPRAAGNCRPFRLFEKKLAAAGGKNR